MNGGDEVSLPGAFELVGMMSNKPKIECPKCGGQITAWADLDAKLTVKVSKTGRLAKPVVENSFQSGGRCGVECSKCDWSLHYDDMYEQSPFWGVASAALDLQERAEGLSIKRKRAD